jgi:hypothetical protein
MLSSPSMKSSSPTSYNQFHQSSRQRTQAVISIQAIIITVLAKQSSLVIIIIKSNNHHPSNHPNPGITEYYSQTMITSSMFHTKHWYLVLEKIGMYWIPVPVLILSETRPDILCRRDIGYQAGYYLKIQMSSKI